MSDEPLYCPFCGAEDFGCECTMWQGSRDTRTIVWCEVCGIKLVHGLCERCDAEVEK
jgi:hypothetical protein